jgi:hypothetical protein
MEKKLTDNSAGTAPVGMMSSRNKSYFYGFVMFAAIAMFVAIGGSVGTQIVRQFVGKSQGADQAMVTALLLNIALILLIWRRTSALSDEVDVYRQAEVRAQHMALMDLKRLTTFMDTTPAINCCARLLTG